MEVENRKVLSDTDIDLSVCLESIQQFRRRLVTNTRQRNETVTDQPRQSDNGVSHYVIWLLSRFVEWTKTYEKKPILWHTCNPINYFNTFTQFVSTLAPFVPTITVNCFAVIGVFLLSGVGLGLGSLTDSYYTDKKTTVYNRHFHFYLLSIYYHYSFSSQI